MHDAGHFLELPAHFVDHRSGRPADRGHRDASEGIGDQAAKDQAGDDIRIREGEVDHADVLEVRRPGIDEMPDVIGVGREQNQRAEARRADRVALGDRLGGVADRVERVGRLTHLFRQGPPFPRCRRHCR